MINNRMWGVYSLSDSPRPDSPRPPDNPIQSERLNLWIMEWEEFILPDWSPSDNPVQSSSIMECEEIILQDWSPPDIPIQSERAKRASSSIMECEEFILTDWSPPDDPAYDYDDYAGDFADDDKNMIMASITT